jgi:hypothetical protein
MKFTDEYTVFHLKRNVIPQAAKVVITTIQRLFSMNLPRNGGHRVNGVNFLSGGPPWPGNDESTRASSRSRP